MCLYGECVSTCVWSGGGRSGEGSVMLSVTVCVFACVASYVRETCVTKGACVYVSVWRVCGCVSARVCLCLSVRPSAMYGCLCACVYLCVKVKRGRGGVGDAEAECLCTVCPRP